jgi:hypothetical protein
LKVTVFSGSFLPVSVSPCSSVLVPDQVVPQEGKIYDVQDVVAYSTSVKRVVTIKKRDYVFSQHALAAGLRELIRRRPPPPPPPPSDTFILILIG